MAYEKIIAILELKKKELKGHIKNGNLNEGKKEEIINLYKEINEALHVLNNPYIFEREEPTDFSKRISVEIPAVS